MSSITKKHTNSTLENEFDDESPPQKRVKDVENSETSSEDNNAVEQDKLERIADAVKTILEVIQFILLCCRHLFNYILLVSW